MDNNYQTLLKFDKVIKFVVNGSLARFVCSHVVTYNPKPTIKMKIWSEPIIPKHTLHCYYVTIKKLYEKLVK